MQSDGDPSNKILERILGIGDIPEQPKGPHPCYCYRKSSESRP